MAHAMHSVPPARNDGYGDGDLADRSSPPRPAPSSISAPIRSLNRNAAPGPPPPPRSRRPPPDTPPPASPRQKDVAPWSADSATAGPPTHPSSSGGGPTSGPTSQSSSSNRGRTKPDRKGFRVPLFVLVCVYLAVSTISVGVIGWQYTVRSASNSISNLSSNIQERIANEISSAIVSTSVIVTQTALYQRELFQAGRWSLTPDRRAATVRSMLAVLNQFNRWSVNLFAMTVPAGELNGWGIWPNQPPSTIMNTVQTNFTRITYLCDLKGTPISVVQNFTDPGDGSVAFPGNNATLSFIAGGLVNFSDPNFHTLSPSSPFLGEAHKTAFVVALNNRTGERILAGADWTMKFIGDILANTTAQIPFPMYVGALESLRGNIIGTSTGFNSVAPDNVTVYNFLQVIADDPFLFDFSRLMNETFPLTMLAADPALAQMTEVVNRVRSTGPLKLSSRINGTKYVVRVDVLTNVTWSLPWVTLQYLDEDSILSSINRTSDKVEIVVLVLIAFAVALGTSFSVFISMQIRAVVRQIAELKRMRFQEVLQYCSSYSSKGVAAPGMNSFVAELYELQLSFYDMTLKFAEHIKMNRRLLRNNNPV